MPKINSKNERKELQKAIVMERGNTLEKRMVSSMGVEKRGLKCKNPPKITKNPPKSLENPPKLKLPWREEMGF